MKFWCLTADPKIVACSVCGVYVEVWSSWHSDYVCQELEDKRMKFGEWLPIETAPKDGTMILVGGRDLILNEGFVVSVYWDGKYWSADGGPIRKATNWMPYPEPPDG